MKNIFIKISITFMCLAIVSCSEDTIDLEGLGSVKGTVVRAGTNEPLENVKISTNPATSTIFTSADGSYRIDNIPSGDYTLSAQKEGLLAEFESISIIADKELEVVFEMDVETAGNRPPDAATLVSPADNAANQPIEVELTWSGNDPDDDALTYTISLRNDENTEVEVFENITDTTYTLSDLAYGVKYFWQVSSSDDINDPVNSITFAFETQNAPNNRIIYSRIVSGNSVIFSADESGGTEIRLTSESKNSFRPRRNINTRKIAFLQSVGSQTHLFTMNEDGSQVNQVTSQVGVSGFNLEEVDFSWDNSGARLLFPNQDKLYSINIDGSGLTLVYQTTNGNLITEVDKNESTGIIALKTNNLNGYEVEIFTINSSGIVQNTVLSGVSGAAGGINLSLDGSQLLYTYDASGFENTEYRRLDSRLYIYNFSSTTATDLSVDKPAGTNDLDARFSPNEVVVIYVNTNNDGLSVRNIERLDISDADNRTTVIGNASMPDWE
ncbi:carboxypeptidase regulatory-like domain-containing protein [Aquimarina sp. 2201CG5-10]|uniref:carboxypeptidase regulatory-like domain-containing protein n=1 Tax=Aquimarina callyspongiae TaxID=3098150 RepID=UPI002AB4C816|nr:carboxypeptidase regulatory-like domain-containing protein [Aquimarina sp. 2201CG5-10]MDY8134288.1 carboxypeptidase regulatory-like domain-containing protein [Aquimarina sp. 2201CG5-10]